MRFPAIIALAFIALLAFAGGPARAQLASCSIGASALNFGSVDPTLNSTASATTTLLVTCGGLNLVGTVQVCVGLGPGTGGAASAASRFMLSGADALTYGLHANGAHTLPWGSSSWPSGGAPARVVSVPVPLLGQGSTSVTVYGLVAAAQQAAPAGTYVSTVEAQVSNGRIGTISDCSTVPVASTTTFSVSATVVPTCRVSASTLDFGHVGLLAAPVTASTVLATTCTKGTPFAIALDGGLSGATDPTRRRMTRGSEAILYGLYRDAAGTQPFGSTGGVDTLAGIGSGFAQSMTVHGRVPPQPTPSAGLYADTIVATVTY